MPILYKRPTLVSATSLLYIILVAKHYQKLDMLSGEGGIYRKAIKSWLSAFASATSVLLMSPSSHGYLQVAGVLGPWGEIWNIPFPFLFFPSQASSTWFSIL